MLQERHWILWAFLEESKMLGREGVHLTKYGKSMFGNRSQNLIEREDDLALLWNK